MADSIYNALKVAMSEKISEINNILTNTLNTERSLTEINKYTNNVAENKELLDNSFFELKDAQISCISMIAICCITKIYVEMAKENINAIILKDRLCQTINAVTNNVSGNIYIASNRVFTESLLNSAEIMAANANFINAHKRIFCEIFTSIPEILESRTNIKNNIDALLREIRIISKAYCDTDFTKHDDIIANENDFFPGQKMDVYFKMVCDNLERCVNSINFICAELFNIENAPKDYSDEVMSSFAEAYAEFENVKILFQDNNEPIHSNKSFNSFIDSINKGSGTLDVIFSSSLEKIFEIDEICDRYECGFDSGRNHEYYKKIVNFFLDLFNKVHSDITTHRDSDTKIVNRYSVSKNYVFLDIGEQVDFLTPGANPINKASINMKYNINSIDADRPNVPNSLVTSKVLYDNDTVIIGGDGEYDSDDESEIPTNEQLKESIGDMILRELFEKLMKIADFFKNLFSKDDGSGTDNSGNLAEDSYGRTPLDGRSENMENSIKITNADGTISYVRYFYSNIKYSDMTSYGLLLLNHLYGSIYRNSFKKVREYLLNRLSLFGFIEGDEISKYGKRVWKFMDKFGTVAYLKDLNAGIVPISLKDFSFFNDIDMRSLLNYDIYTDGDKTESSEITSFEDKFNNITGILETNDFFTVNENIELKVLKTLLRSSVGDKNECKKIFYILATEYNLRSQLLAYIVCKHMKNIFYSGEDGFTKIDVDCYEFHNVYEYLTEIINLHKFYKSLFNRSADTVIVADQLLGISRRVDSAEEG